MSIIIPYLDLLYEERNEAITELALWTSAEEETTATKLVVSNVKDRLSRANTAIEDYIKHHEG